MSYILKNVTRSDVLQKRYDQLQSRCKTWKFSLITTDFVHGLKPCWTKAHYEVKSEAEKCLQKKHPVYFHCHSALLVDHRLLLLLGSAGTKVCGWCVSTNKPNFLSAVLSYFRGLSLVGRICIVLLTVILGTS